MALTETEILALSPDSSSSKAALGLLSPAKWGNLGSDADSVWGECQGSGSKPYQVRVDLHGPAFKCSCPSRKFPCKHGLAVMILNSRSPDKFPVTPQPEWVSEWISTRRKKEEVKSKEAETPKPPDPKAEENAKKRENARWQRMLTGLSDLDLWMDDHLRNGFSRIPSNSEGWFKMAAAMVDAQLPPIASALRSSWSLIGNSRDWPEQILQIFGRIALLSSAAKNLESLPEDLGSVVRQSLGLYPDKKDVLNSNTPIMDDWLVLSIEHSEEENIWTRKVWFLGRKTGKFGISLDFSYGTRKYDTLHFIGDVNLIGMTYYPGISVQRVLVGDQQDPESEVFQMNGDALSMLESSAEQLAKNPFITTHPALFTDAVLIPVENSWIVNSSGMSMPALFSNGSAWSLLAVTGGLPFTLFSEWDGRYLKPLSAWRDGKNIWRGVE